jgi:peptidoglycan-associated lipoprotein
MIRSIVRHPLAVAVAAAVIAAACGRGQQPPAVRPTPPPPAAVPAPSPQPERPPAPPEPVVEPVPAPPEPLTEEDLSSKDLDAINREAPLKPAFFAFDSTALDDAARAALDEDAAVLRRYPTWVITIEGHCDERGTAEYNLALGERRALAAKSYLVEVGIPADRLRTVSYGKEFPFDPGHDEAAWARNRRAHFVVTAK